MIVRKVFIMKNTNENSEIQMGEKNNEWKVLKEEKKEAKSVSIPETYQMSIIGYIFGNN